MVKDITMTGNTKDDNLIRKQPAQRQSDSFAFIRTLIKDTVAGAAGGAACVVAGQPLDTVKVKMQTFPDLYRGSVHCLLNTFKREGFRGLYAGSSPAFLVNISENSVLFLSYGRCLDATCYIFGKKSVDDLQPIHRAISGGLAAVFATLVICPTELVKCRLQAHEQLVDQMRKEGVTPARLPQKKSSLQLAASVLREEGIRGFYRGYSSTLIRDPGGYFFFFYGYEFTRKFLTPDNAKPGILTTILAGGIGGAALWTAIFPLDLVKSRQQVFAEQEKRTFFRMLIEIGRQDGFTALYRGLGPTLVRSFPANGALFLAYEFTKSILN